MQVCMYEHRNTASKDHQIPYHNPIYTVIRKMAVSTCYSTCHAHFRHAVVVFLFFSSYFCCFCLTNCTFQCKLLTATVGKKMSSRPLKWNTYEITQRQIWINTIYTYIHTCVYVYIYVCIYKLIHTYTWYYFENPKSNIMAQFAKWKQIDNPQIHPYVFI